MLPLVHWDPRDPRLHFLRACVASIVSYVFFNRRECIALCPIEDLVVTSDHITLRLREEKGHKALRAGMRNTMQIGRSDLPRVRKPAKGVLHGHQYHGPSPRAPMGPEPRRRQGTVDGIDMDDMVTRGLS